MLSISSVSVTETLSKTLNRSFHGRQRAGHCETETETSHDGSGGSKLPASERAQPRKLITILDIPAWYRDNPFILSGYRPLSNSTARCAESLLYVHNETANIWSHLLAAAVFILAQSALQRYLASSYPTIDVGDRLAIAFEGFTAAICFISSATYHSLICHSEPIFRMSLKCDYAGIIILIIGNFLSGLHISFHSAPNLARVYSFMILSLGSMTSFIVLSPYFQGPKYFNLRLRAFILTGLSGFLPVIHAFVRFGPATFWRLGGNCYLLEGALLLAGSYIFTKRIPECWAPGTFDIWGQSHTIWHILVFLAMGVHVYGLLEALDYNYNRDYRNGHVEIAVTACLTETGLKAWNDME